MQIFTVLISFTALSRNLDSGILVKESENRFLKICIAGDSHSHVALRLSPHLRRLRLLISAQLRRPRIKHGRKELAAYVRIGANHLSNCAALQGVCTDIYVLFKSQNAPNAFTRKASWWGGGLCPGLKS
uniref:Uncharacterized protein n=1 Tax=Sphaerodactylus townsendi TaxID=933632 RepID=A0ACB8E5J9_9SAUR